MKIKYLLQLLCIFALFSAANLMAQSIATPPPVHIGSSSPYKIGTPDDPVIAEEYCAFLNNPWNVNRSSIQYYDASVITSDKGGADYEYFVISGHDTDIIDAVPFQYLQTQFNDWRLNPTISDLCDYMNYMSHGQTDEADALKNNYLNCTVGFKGNPDIFQQVDNFIVVHNNNAAGGIFLNERYAHLLVAKGSPMQVSVIFQSAKYDRPLQLFQD